MNFEIAPSFQKKLKKTFFKVQSFTPKKINNDNNNNSYIKKNYIHQNEEMERNGGKKNIFPPDFYFS